MCRSIKVFAAVIVAGAFAVWAGMLLHAREDEGDSEQKSEQPEAQPATPDDAREDIPLREFMRAKLASSNKILEGLVTEDHDLIREGARKLHEMSDAEEWRVSNESMYRQFSSEFQRITQQLTEAAEDEDLDQAALKWMAATMSCIECHHYVRGIRLADDAE